MRALMVFSAALLVGCPGGNPTDAQCLEGDPSVRMGTGAGGVFNDITAGEVLELGAAAQGGNGVRVNVRTTGLDSTQPMDVEVIGILNGETSAAFVFEDTQLFCQDDGEAMIEGLTVGFEQSLGFGDLDGQTAELQVIATDAAGESAESTVSVELVAP